MIIFLYGPDAYRRQAKQNEIVDSWHKKHGNLALGKFDLEEEEEFGKFADFVKKQSLFESVKLVIVSGVKELIKEDQKNYIGLLKEKIEDKNTTILIAEDSKPTKDFNFLLKEPVIFQEFANLEGVDVDRFILREVKRLGLALDKAARELLAKVFIGNSWALISELEKLALLNKKEIGLDDIYKYCDLILPLNFFGTINELRGGRLSARLSALESFFSRGEESAMIFNMIASSPYADKKWRQQMADYDADVKMGKLEYEEVLLNLCL